MALMCHVRRSVFDRVLDLLVAMLCCECSRRSLNLSRPSFFSATRCFLGAAPMCGEGWGAQPPKMRCQGARGPQINFSHFYFHLVSKKTKFGHIRHGPLVNTSHSKCSSITIYIQNLTKLSCPTLSVTHSTAKFNLTIISLGVWHRYVPSGITYAKHCICIRSLTKKSAATAVSSPRLKAKMAVAKAAPW